MLHHPYIPAKAIKNNTASIFQVWLLKQKLGENILVILPHIVILKSTQHRLQPLQTWNNLLDCAQETLNNV